MITKEDLDLMHTWALEHPEVAKSEIKKQEKLLLGRSNKNKSVTIKVDIPWPNKRPTEIQDDILHSLCELSRTTDYEVDVTEEIEFAFPNAVKWDIYRLCKYLPVNVSRMIKSRFFLQFY